MSMLDFFSKKAVTERNKIAFKLELFKWEGKEKKKAIKSNVKALNSMINFNGKLFGEVECVWYEKAYAVTVRSKKKHNRDYTYNYLSFDDLIFSVTGIAERYMLIRDVYELVEELVTEQH